MMILEVTLHILNGQVMYNHFAKTDFLDQEWMAPFNEAMCYGATCIDLFSPEFIELRASVHQVTPVSYSQITIQPLQPLFEQKYSQIQLWFDPDMFCQINLLTVLAWLDQNHYQGQTILNLVNEQYELIDRFTLGVDGYEELYKNVLINKENPGHVEPAPLKKGIERYLHYLDQDSDLMLFIQRHQEAQVNELVALLIENFKEYGLGDTQYERIIKAFREGDGK